VRNGSAHALQAAPLNETPLGILPFATGESQVAARDLRENGPAVTIQLTERRQATVGEPDVFLP